MMEYANGGTAISEEIQSLAAIFCSDGEFQGSNTAAELKEQDYATSFTLNLKSKDIKYSIKCAVPETYPFVIPVWMIECRQISEVKKDLLLGLLLTHLEVFCGEPMLMEAIMFIQEKLHEEHESYFDLLPVSLSTIQTESDTAANEDIATDQRKQVVEEMETLLLKLDHMRDTKRYSKIMKKWTNELALVGAVILHKNLIFIIVQGVNNDTREFIKRMRTQNVDVDSKGRSCKERMMNIIAQLSVGRRFTDEFVVVETDIRGRVESLFVKAGLGAFLKDCMK